MLTYRRPSALRLLALVFALVTGLALALGAIRSGAQAQTDAGYTFTKVADSVEDGFDPFSFGCAAINAPGDIAFRAGRLAPDGFNTTPGIYRANADGTLTTIAEDPKRFIGFNPSINDSGQVSFAARLDGGKKEDTEAILRGEGRKLTTIASTADEFAFFGFDTSINNSGAVAFTAELDNGDEGLFSGSGGKKGGVTTHYLTSTSEFDGSDSRPAINIIGDIAFVDSIDFARGIFVGQEGDFTEIVAPDPSDPSTGYGTPTLNDAGTAAFQRSFTDEATQEFVEQIVTGNGGPLMVVADTRDGFAFFGFRPPSINNDGEVAYHATLDDGTSGIFVGSDPVADRVIATGDTLDGSIVQILVFCEEGLSDSGELAFVAELQDPDTPEGSRVAVFRATPTAERTP